MTVWIALLFLAIACAVIAVNVYDNRRLRRMTASEIAAENAEISQRIEPW